MMAEASAETDQSIELLMRIVRSSRFQTTEDGDSPDNYYDVLVYAPTDLSELKVKFTPYSEVPAHIPSEYNRWRLQAIETLHIRSEYTPAVPQDTAFHIYKLEDYFRWFASGVEDNRYAYHQIQNVFSDPLKRVFESDNQQQLLIWWDCASPVLGQLPWELGIYSSTNKRIMLHRGAPPKEARQPVPFYGKLSLAVIGQHENSNWEMGTWFNLKNQANLDVQIFDGQDPIAALRKVAEEGIELVHLFARGTLTETFEGILYLNNGKDDDYNRELTGRDLANLLKYSRVSTLAFGSSTELGWDNQQDPEVMWTYRAFAALGSTSHRLPAIVAPLGPLGIERATAFWTAYYNSLSGAIPPGGSSDNKYVGDIAVAMDSGRQALAGIAPVATYPRGYAHVVAQPLTLEEIITRASSQAADYQVWHALLPEELLAQRQTIEQLSKWRGDPALIKSIRQALRKIELDRLSTRTVSDLVAVLQELTELPDGFVADIQRRLVEHLSSVSQPRAAQ